MGAMYAKTGRCGSLATVCRIHAIDTLPMTLVRVRVRITVRVRVRD